MVEASDPKVPQHTERHTSYSAKWDKVCRNTWYGACTLLSKMHERRGEGELRSLKGSAAPERKTSRLIWSEGTVVGYEDVPVTVTFQI